ncbi:MAG: formate-dependent phosphoribosylglycinamide formyltransferase [Planctomycetota bacterium]|jgi:phosphoribosylglycinamide formyltransferase 2|nr:MAG: formate-dependent phosphoribosylglycinamide formyltransferase [Planctomycetota bacterium]RLS94449.1 MAG: formate-dependent phosphoribosylglycinamide formyltransferase [Planctomycetota bacterium]
MSAKILLLGSGELGKEFVISAKRLGCRVIAVDRYADAPAMQVADAHEVIDMLDGRALQQLAKRHKPDFIVPEIEAIRTEELLRLEKAGFSVVPSAFAAHMTMNRDAIRDLAARELKLLTARYAYAASAVELQQAILGPRGMGFPCVVKPTMSSSGKGQSVLRSKRDIAKAFDYAVANMRGDKPVVIVEEFINFDYEITLLTVKERRAQGGGVKFVEPIGHRQERGDYQESWMPCPMKPAAKRAAQRMAQAVVERLAGKDGAGIFGVEFFVQGDRVIFSELSPRPHDTGMVTLRSQDLSEFDLHLRAILGLPIPSIRYAGATASAVVLATRDSTRAPRITGVEKALEIPSVEVRIFGKPSTRKHRRMGVVLAHGATAAKARAIATRAAAMIQVR